ncbi:MAG: CapA family protein [FCB group bacterium]|nr:CapA family protein [FCB group bacterium]
MKKVVKILACGDLMLGEWHFSRGFGMNKILRKYGPDFPFENVSAFFNEADLVIGNLECNFAPAGKARKHPMLAADRFIPALKKAGINTLSVANNHLLDFGPEMAGETVKRLIDEGFQVIGLNHEPGVYIDADGCNVYILAADILPLHHKRPPYRDDSIIYSGSLEDLGPDIISRIEDSPAGYKIVYLHWGEEFIDHPDNIQVYWARKMIDSGADAVIGSHPHVPQGVEKSGSGVIAYSLGNFISDMPYPPTKTGYVLELNLSPVEKKLTPNIIPYTITDDFRPVLIKNLALSGMFKGLNEKILNIETDLEKPEMDPAYTAAARQAEIEMWDWTKSFYRKNFWKYPLSAQWGWFKEKVFLR